MKKLLFLYSSVLILSYSFLLNSCKGDDPKQEDRWSVEEKQSHDQAINTQQDIGEDLDRWFQTMDSLDAIKKAHQAFTKSEIVTSATINTQGIAVQYANGMRGGLFLNPRDDKTELSKPALAKNIGESESSMESLVNKKKMILLNPHYFERSYYTDQVHSISKNNLKKVNIDLATFYKNEEATVDRFTQLSGYGIIQIYSHGWAWPKQENITDVYLLTGETANDATSSKYWSDVKTGNIPIVKVAGPNKYLISPKFIRKYNDFSKDTVLFFGGFCYSFLGNWPDIIDSFADGAYLGYDWSVYTHKNANWSVNSIANLSDTTANKPITLNDWFLKTDVEKSYWSESNNRTVKIHYVGDGKLKLWDKLSIEIIELSSDGTPVTKPGEKGKKYSFKCKVTTKVSPIEFVWNIGDGSNPLTTQGSDVSITWNKDGVYDLTVTVKNKTTGASLGSAKIKVTIGDDSNKYVEFLKKVNFTSVDLNGTQYKYIDYWGFGGGFSFNISGPLTLDGLNFSGSYAHDDIKESIKGSLSKDGQKASFTATREGVRFGKYKIVMTVTDYPLRVFNELNFLIYEIKPPGTKSYVTGFEGYIESSNIRHDLTLSSFHWNELTEFNLQFSILP